MGETNCRGSRKEGRGIVPSGKVSPREEEKRDGWLTNEKAPSMSLKSEEDHGPRIRTKEI